MGIDFVVKTFEIWDNVFDFVVYYVCVYKPWVVTSVHFGRVLHGYVRLGELPVCIVFMLYVGM